MKIQICAEIEGLFLLKDKVEAKLYPYEFCLFVKESKKYISITKPVKDYMPYAPKMYDKDGILQIETTKPEIYKDIKDWLYYIEAMGAFNFKVSKIHTDELDVTWIYENESEEGQIPFTTSKMNKEEEKAEKFVTNDNLFNLVIFRRMLPEAHIPFTYYRHGKEFFDQRNFYFSFINYFMMLEFCFADGKFQKKDVINNFVKSNLLKLCILSAISMFKDNNCGENYAWLMSECKSRQKDMNHEAIIYILVEYRGLLSHASKRSKDFLFNDIKLRPLAFIISMICFFLCGYIQVYSCSTEDDKNRMMLERIEKLKEKLGWQ